MTYNFYYFYNPFCLLWLLLASAFSVFANTSASGTKIDSADTFALLENNSTRFENYSYQNDL
jgi:hypothetical protein